MIGRTVLKQPLAPLTRLAALSPLDDRACAALEFAVQMPRHYRARRDLLIEGEEITETRIVLSGWAARVRTLEDGRRQIIGFLLPGDLIGSCEHERPMALSTVSALTDLAVCTAPKADVSSALARAYALSRALDEKHLLAQVVRLGSYDAQERIADFLLEILERLQLASLTADNRFALPLTQEMLGDTLGLTAVHVNRTLQVLRREGAVEWKSEELHISDPAGLARRIGRSTVKVTAA